MMTKRKEKCSTESIKHLRSFNRNYTQKSLLARHFRFYFRVSFDERCFGEQKFTERDKCVEMATEDLYKGFGAWSLRELSLSSCFLWREENKNILERSKFLEPIILLAAKSPCGACFTESLKLLSHAARDKRIQLNDEKLFDKFASINKSFSTTFAPALKLGSSINAICLFGNRRKEITKQREKHWKKLIKKRHRSDGKVL